MRIGDWVLQHKDGRPMAVGCKVVSFRGEEFELAGGAPPKHEASTGRVYIKSIFGGQLELFPSVYDLVWVNSPLMTP